MERDKTVVTEKKNCGKSGIAVEHYLHGMMSFMGGFLGAYSIASRMGLFASAQTGNMIHIVECVYERNGKALLLRIGFAVVFASALVISYFLKNKRGCDLRGSCMIVDAAAIVIMSLIPVSAEPLISIYPLAFAASFQWGTFSGTGGYNSSTIFSTNNFRQFIWGVTEFICSRSNEAKKRVIYYGTTLLMFLSGAWLGFAVVDWLGVQGGLLGLIPLGVSGMILKVRKKTEVLESCGFRI